MIYQLYDTKDRSEPRATHDCGDNFLAEKWARQWAIEQDASDDFALESEDGTYAASLFRTIAGQWYVMRR